MICQIKIENDEIIFDSKRQIIKRKRKKESEIKDQKDK